MNGATAPLADGPRHQPGPTTRAQRITNRPVSWAPERYILNASHLSTEGHYSSNVSARKLVELVETVPDGEIIAEHLLTPTEARSLAQQLDAGQSRLPDGEARSLVHALFQSARSADDFEALPEAALAIYERLHSINDITTLYQSEVEPGVCRLGLIAMHDLATLTGLDRQGVNAALDSLRHRDLIEDLASDPGMAPRIRLRWIRSGAGTAAVLGGADLEAHGPHA
jgi:hypothetical protein